MHQQDRTIQTLLEISDQIDQLDHASQTLVADIGLIRARLDQVRQVLADQAVWHRVDQIWVDRVAQSVDRLLLGLAGVAELKLRDPVH